MIELPGDQTEQGTYHEVIFQDCGHLPHREKQEEMLQVFLNSVDAH